MKRRQASRVFFPWERRRGLLGLLGRARVRLVLSLGLTFAVLLWLRGREQRAAAVRATRASITTLSRAVWSYRADHAGGCPRALGELVSGGYARELPVDGWGRPLRLTCPGRKDPRGFDLASDGPDGIPGGLDRVE